MQPAKPFSNSCEKNKEPILSVLKDLFNEAGLVLEIGSGTGQHAIYFADKLPHLNWAPTDLEDKITGIKMWLNEAAIDRIEQPRILDLLSNDWPIDVADYVFTANTTHYVSWAHIEAMFKGVGKVLADGGIFAQYGPFNYGGKFTSESNARFDTHLKASDPSRGIKNFEDLNELAQCNGLKLLQDHPMPSNNRILAWSKSNP
ncbi:MAG: SAM-dependent methyltransferase [Candidatus Omnitrophota bacterium]|jgi:SAM-dependent methyltransferase